jgi:hypothetical protein
MVINRTLILFARLKSLIFFDKHELSFLKKQNRKQQKRNFNDKTILFQCINDYFYVLLFSIVINELQDKNAKRIGIINVPLKIKEIHYILLFPILIKYILYKLEIRKLKKIYKAIGIDDFIYHTQFDMFFNLSILKKSLSIYLKLKTKHQLQKLEIDGVKIGDLVIDTYLRYHTINTLPTLNLRGFWLFKVIYDTFGILEFHTEFAQKNKINKAFFAMSVYIYHGIPARVYTNSDVDVFVAGGFTKLFKKLDSDFYYSMQKDHTYFKRDFEKSFSDKERVIGKNKFKERFEGIDDTGYFDNLKVIGGLNTYDKSNNYDLQYKLDGVIFLHDFYDAHKIYGETIFSDFYQWATFTLDIIREHNLNIGIKPHPHDFIIHSTYVVNKLKKEYDDLIWIDKNVSNTSIFNSGIKFGISHSGSVLSELAFHKIVPICCYENSTSSFDFVYQANSIEEYLELLFRANKLTVKASNQVYEYYYMNYILNNSDYQIKSNKVIGINIKGINRFNTKSSDLIKINEV